MGKTIKVYLANESVSGIRHVEIANWSGQALACPRSRFHELREWPEVRRPGVYFLFGIDDQTGEETTYIGEAEVVIDRLASHMSGKDFWTELVTFTSKDENLTKAHVRYLESQLITMAKQAGRYRLTNATSSQLPSLPRSDRDAMLDFIGSVQMLLGVLGHKVLESLVTAPSAPVRSDTLFRALAASRQVGSTSGNSDSPITDLAAFRLHVADIAAYAIRTDEGIVVLADSEASLESRASLTGGLLGARLALIESGVLVAEGAKHKFVKNHLFRSPSQAAAVIVGYSINGRESWRLPDGTSWGKYEKNLSLASESSSGR